MRGAGSTYNDIADRKLDAQVERTRHRPLPSGQVSPRAAALFLGLELLVGLLVLLQFRPFGIAVGLASLLPVAIYPFMKRVMPLPQLVLGFAFAWGALMGWAGALDRLGAAPVLLYLGTIAWTVGYDTIYAVQDLEDDAIVGIRSSARTFGAGLKPAVAACFAITVAGVLAALAAASGGPAGLLEGGGPVGLVGVALFALHLFGQVRRLDPRDGRGALRLFRANRDAGLILFAGLALDAVVGALL